MYRNLAPRPLGLMGCRDNELIELALTHRFSGIEIDFLKFQDQVSLKGLPGAMRYLANSPLKISSGELPLNWSGSEEEFAAAMAALPEYLESAEKLKCPAMYVTLMSGSNDRTYPENFDLHRRRLEELAEPFRARGMRLGIHASMLASDRGNRVYPFIDTVEQLLALVKTTSAKNVGILLDTWHWTVGGGTLQQIRDLGVDRIIDVRLADLPTDVAMDKVTHEHRNLPGSNGRVENLAIVKLLQGIGYSGPLTPYPNRKQIGAKSREQGVERTAESLTQLLEDAGIIEPRLSRREDPDPADLSPIL